MVIDYKYFLIFILINGLTLSSWEKELKLKLLKPMPQWIDKQIQSDFLTIKNNPSQLNLENIELSPTLVLYKINNNILNLKKSNEKHSITQAREIVFTESLKKISKVISLPNITFLVDFSDGSNSNIGPILAMSKLKNLQTQVILIPDTDCLRSRDLAQALTGTKIHKWKNKFEKAFWRGATTGGAYSMITLKTISRYKLVELSRNFPNILNAKFTSLVQLVDDQVGKYIKSQNLISNPVPVKDHLKYKYQITVDGNTATWSRFFWQLHANSLIFKQNSNWIQWYYNALVPYEHYIPFDIENTDLIDKIKFAKQHDNKAQEIVKKANQFAHQNLKYSDMLYYIYQVLINLSKLH